MTQVEAACQPIAEWARKEAEAEQRSRIAALEAVIEQVRGARQWHPHANRWFYPPNDIDEALSAGPSTVLDQMIREAKAEAWDERHALTHAWSEDNPYREETR